MRLGKKSQIVVTDLMMAMFIFIALLTAVMLVWNRYVLLANEQVEYEEAQIMAYQISNILIKNKGKPVDWEKNVSNVHIIGLATSDRHVSLAKVNAFFNISYNTSKNIFNIPYYDFSLQIKDFYGNNLTGYYGNIPAGNFIISLRRYALYENEKAIIEFKLWR